MDYNIIQNKTSEFQLMFDRLKYQIRTTTTGIIQSFDPATQTCSVLPAIRMRHVKENGEIEFLNLPLLTNVPYLINHAGSFSITMPISVGDRCTLIFSERALDNFKKTGKLSNPEEGISSRSHHLTDAMATFGFFPLDNPLLDYSTDAISIRSDKDGEKSVFLDLSKTDITLNSNEAQIFMQKNKIVITVGAITVTLDSQEGQQGGVGKVTVESGNIDFVATENITFKAKNIELQASDSLEAACGIIGQGGNQSVSKINMLPASTHITQTHPSGGGVSQNMLSVTSTHVGAYSVEDATAGTSGNSTQITLNNNDINIISSNAPTQGENPVAGASASIKLTSEEILAKSSDAGENADNTSIKLLKNNITISNAQTDSATSINLSQDNLLLSNTSEGDQEPKVFMKLLTDEIKIGVTYTEDMVTLEQDGRINCQEVKVKGEIIPVLLSEHVHEKDNLLHPELTGKPAMEIL